MLITSRVGSYEVMLNVIPVWTDYSYLLVVLLDGYILICLLSMSLLKEKGNSAKISNYT